MWRPASSSFRDTMLTIRSILPPINFITLHYAYFIVVCLLSSLIFWGSSEPFRSVKYVDSIFLAVSGMTNTGLNTVNLSQLTAWQQVILWLLMIIGSPVWVSIWTVYIRKRAFEKRFRGIVAQVREMRQRRAEAAAAAGGGGLRLNRLYTLSFRKAKTEPPIEPSMPGLGTRRTASTSRAPALPVGMRSLGDVHDHQNTTEPVVESTTDDDRRTVPVDGGDDSQASRATGDHIAFANDPHPRTQGQIYDRRNSQYSLRTAVDRALQADEARANDDSSSDTQHPDDFRFHWKKILGKHNVTRNSQFHNLSAEDRERLGGCEYRALKVLVLLVSLYSFLWQFLGAMALGGWISTYMTDPAERSGANGWWTGIFLSVSAFGNNGYSLIDENMVPFQGDYFVLITVGALIMAGNIAFPLLLRLAIWFILNVMHLTTAADSLAEWKETFEFILKYPRRVFTTLFPSRPTWWLFLVLVLTTTIDWLAFELLNIGNKALDSTINVGNRVIDGLFQAVAVRTGGFVVVSLPSLYIGTLVIYVVMMYVSVYPVVITMRHSNVYEERSLGIYDEHRPGDETEDEEDNSDENLQNQATPVVSNGVDVESGQPPSLRRRRSVAAAADTANTMHKTVKSLSAFHGVGASHPPHHPHHDPRISFLKQQIHGQLAHDLWWLILATIIIVIIETDHYRQHPITYSTFNIVFEIVSAYGTVGISMGLPNQTYSFSGGWHAASKVVLCFVMIRGRHRGLPVALDRAVRLPGEHLARDEEEDHQIRKWKTVSRANLERLRSGFSARTSEEH